VFIFSVIEQIFFSLNLLFYKVKMVKLIKKIKSFLVYKYLVPVIHENQELITNGFVSVFLEKFKGIFWMDARSHLFQRIWVNGSYENDNVVIIEKLLSDRPGDVIDVGANVGFFSIFLSKTIPEGKKVLSIEPNPHALELLIKNIQLNNCSDSIILFEGIASSKSSNIILNLIDGLPEYSSPKNIKHLSVKNFHTTKLEVQANTIDELVKIYNLSPKFIKIDVEGSELEVIKGCTKTLEKYKPHLLIEIVEYLNDKKQESVVNLLHDLGYRLYNKKLKLQKKNFIGDYICIHNSNKLY
jgi:FkbM family methyltransferase